MFCEKFTESWFNRDDHRILGSRVLPYSLWHQTVLASLEANVLTSKEPLKWADLELLRRVCLLRHGETPKKTIPVFSKVRFWLRIMFRSFGKEIEKLTHYFNDYNQPPEFWTQADQGGSSRGSMPEVLFVATNLMLLGFTEKEAWEMPVGKAFWYSGAYIENGAGNPLNWKTGYDKLLEEEIKRRIAEGKIQTSPPLTKK